MHHPGKSIFSALAVLAAAATSAAGAERVVMPYICTALGSAVELDASKPRSYDIVGRHEQDSVTHCSPTNPNRCKTWRVHRFDIDCNGTRVPWHKVVAAASELNNGPAFIQDGQLSIRMRPPGPRQGMARSPDGGGFAGPPPPGAFGRFDRTPAGRGDIAVMPPGFAPVIAMKATFAAAPPVSSVQPGSSNTAGPGAGAKEPVTKAGNDAKPIAVPPPRPAERPAAEPAPKPAIAEKNAPAPATAPTSNAAPPSSTGAQDKPPSAPGLTILNAGETAGAASPAASNPPVEAPPAPQTSSEPSSPSPPSAATPPAASDKIVAVTAVDLADEAHAAPPPASTASGSGPALWQIMSILLAAAAATGAFAFYARQQRQAPIHTAPERDLAAISLGEPAARNASHDAKALVTVPEAAQRDEPIAPPEVPPAAPLPGTLSAAIESRAASGWLPATRADALLVLGASPDASFEAIRKIVDGLRQSWHPDLARTDEDRLMREQRMKLINVAWDILQRARRAA